MRPAQEGSEPVKHVASNLKPNITATNSDLRSLCERLASNGRFAFDTEFIMEDGFESDVCLIQAATESEVALIDPLAELDTAPFWELVADPAVEVILHAGTEDLALCHQLTGQLPANVFDVQVAAGLVGRDYPLSLRRLVQGMLRVRLHKSQTLTDWRRRPLSEAQQTYAVEDVAFIPAVYHGLHSKLDKLQRLDWARQEFARFEELTTYEPPKQTQIQRLKGAGSLKPRSLAVASELLEERASLASDYNRPVRAVLKDHLLVEIARHRWTNPQQIRSLRGLHLRRAAFQRLADAVKRGMQVPEEQCPLPPSNIEDTPEEIILTALMTAVLRGFCHTNRLAFPLLATKQQIRERIHAHTRSGPDPSVLSTGWRADACGQLIDDVLSGHTVLRVNETNGKTELQLLPHTPAPSA